MTELNESFAFEYVLSKKYRTIEQTDKISLCSAVDVAEFAKTLYNGDIGIYESFFCIYLNNSNNVLGYSKISQGGITNTPVDIRLIFNNAILSLSTAIILIHNHPSGKLTPSHADISITRKIKEAGELLDIRVLDHLIITEEDYISIIDQI